jgi:hypothetical protein
MIEVEQEYLKVIDAPGLYRDPHSKAIVSADVVALQSHRKRKQAMRQVLNKNEELRGEIDQVKQRLNGLESKLEKIISLLEK